MEFLSGDIFSGCGGLTLGMKNAGFSTRFAVEIDDNAVNTFRLNHGETQVIAKDIRAVKASEISDILKDRPLHFLAGCPPCQGFSTIRRLNKRRNKRDPRNSLVLEYLRLVRELSPITIMLENVPGLKDYFLFRELVRDLKGLGYWLDYDVVNIRDFGVPQNRRRLVLVGSQLGDIKIARASGGPLRTVRQTIGKLPSPTDSKDWVHKVVATHTKVVRERIELTPKNGGSRKDLPEKYKLACHTRIDSGFNDIYGRLRWDDVSSTITGGCLNPSKGRFLHPEQDRCISAREAALLQSFPKDYKFAKGTSKTDLALMIGNALPPKFSYYQSRNIYNHLRSHLVTD